MSAANQYEPEPNNLGIKVYPFVFKDLRERILMGKKKHKVYLKTANGRNSLWDLIQELYDAIFYLRKLILETEDMECGHPGIFRREADGCEYCYVCYLEEMNKVLETVMFNGSSLFRQRNPGAQLPPSIELIEWLTTEMSNNPPAPLA